MIRRHLTIPFLILALTLVSTMVGSAGAPATVAATATAPANAERIARGQYLVRFGLCHDCHTPQKPGPAGIEPDLTRALSGRPGTP